MNGKRPKGIRPSLWAGVQQRVAAARRRSPEQLPRQRQVVFLGLVITPPIDEPVAGDVLVADAVVNDFVRASRANGRALAGPAFFALFDHVDFDRDPLGNGRIDFAHAAVQRFAEQKSTHARPRNESAKVCRFATTLSLHEG